MEQRLHEHAFKLSDTVNCMFTTVLQWTFLCHSVVVLRAEGIWVFCALLCGCSLPYTQRNTVLQHWMQPTPTCSVYIGVYLLYTLSLFLRCIQCYIHITLLNLKHVLSLCHDWICAYHQDHRSHCVQECSLFWWECRVSECHTHPFPSHSSCLMLFSGSCSLPSPFYLSNQTLPASVRVYECQESASHKNICRSLAQLFQGWSKRYKRLQGSGFLVSLCLDSGAC